MEQSDASAETSPAYTRAHTPVKFDGACGPGERDLANGRISSVFVKKREACACGRGKQVMENEGPGLIVTNPRWAASNRFPMMEKWPGVAHNQEKWSGAELMARTVEN
jgi:hypothetical protein